MSLIYPILAQVLLTLIVIGRVGQTRAVRGRAPGSDAAAAPRARDFAAQASANLRNQSEAPVLFYVLCFGAMQIGSIGIWMGLLAWLFVVSRYVHAAIHLTYNHIPHRFAVFLFGVVVLILMWLVVALRLLGL